MQSIAVTKTQPCPAAARSRPGRAGLWRGRGKPGWLLAAALALGLQAGGARADGAIVVELYEHCRLVDTEVVIDSATLSRERAAEVNARVNAVTGGGRDALPRVVRILRNHGIRDVSVSRRGFEDCEPQAGGHAVEAVGTYCGPALHHAEVLVDKKSVYSASDPDMTFEAFLDRAVRRLRAQGIAGRPRVSIENAPDCEAAE